MKNQFLLRILLNTFAVVIASYILSGIHIGSFGYAILVAVVLAFLNVFLKPILVLITLPATLFSFGLFLLFVNAFVVKTSAWLIGDGFR
ncbi:MAG TPA: phage holin family protein, partial [Chitinophagales bacterium]